MSYLCLFNEMAETVGSFDYISSLISFKGKDVII